MQPSEYYPCTTKQKKNSELIDKNFHFSIFAKGKNRIISTECSNKKTKDQQSTN